MVYKSCICVLTRILRPESARIKLPQDYDPIAALNHLEALHSFTSVTMEKLPPSTAKDTVRTES